jgi:hypothetical protein
MKAQSPRHPQERRARPPGQGHRTRSPGSASPRSATCARASTSSSSSPRPTRPGPRPCRGDVQEAARQHRDRELLDRTGGLMKREEQSAGLRRHEHRLRDPRSSTATDGDESAVLVGSNRRRRRGAGDRAGHRTPAADGVAWRRRLREGRPDRGPGRLLLRRLSALRRDGRAVAGDGRGEEACGAGRAGAGHPNSASSRRCGTSTAPTSPRRNG